MSGIIREIRPRLYEAGRMSGSSSKVQEQFRDQGYSSASLEQLGELRVQEGRHDSKITLEGSYASEWVIYIPEKRPYLVPPFLTLPGIRKAVEAHRTDKEFYLSNKQLSRAITNGIELPEESFGISTDQFESDSRAIWMFGREDKRKAKAYGDFLREPVGAEQLNVEVLTVSLLPKDEVNFQKRAFARRVFLSGLKENSLVDSTVKGLDMSHFYWGIRKARRA